MAGCGSQAKQDPVAASDGGVTPAPTAAAPGTGLMIDGSAADRALLATAAAKVPTTGLATASVGPPENGETAKAYPDEDEVLVTFSKNLPYGGQEAYWQSVLLAAAARAGSIDAARDRVVGLLSVTGGGTAEGTPPMEQSGLPIGHGATTTVPFLITDSDHVAAALSDNVAKSGVTATMSRVGEAQIPEVDITAKDPSSFVRDWPAISGSLVSGVEVLTGPGFLVRVTDEEGVPLAMIGYVRNAEMTAAWVRPDLAPPITSTAG